MGNKVALVTIHTGFNYGSLLQAYAMTCLIKECGYEPVMLWHNEGFVKGRDVTLSKLLTIMWRSLLHPKSSKRVIGAYTDTYSYKMSDVTKQKFIKFADDYYDVKKMSFSKMKHLCETEDIKAVCCGSDQIWKSNLLYVSPYYFLRFAPKYKRIAYAPSFGGIEIPDYNKKLFSKYLKDFSALSVREESGGKIIKELIGKECFVALDPTLAVNPAVWERMVNKKSSEEYILCYFLDEPNDKVLDNIRQIQKMFNLSIKIIPYIYDCFSHFNKCSFENAGPLEFLNLIFNAKIIFTDSFHCSVFSVLYQKPFYVFERNHKKAISGNTRIENFLQLTNLQNRYVDNNSSIDFSKVLDCDFSVANKNLNIERNKSLSFLKSAIGDVYDRK